MSNVRLVHDRVKRYEGRSSLAREDLVQEGILGLFRAASKYDPERGFRFATYATWWIDQKIHRLIMDKGQVIRVPIHIQQKLGELKRRQRQLANKLGRKPTSAELASELGAKIADVEFLRAIQRDIQSLDQSYESETTLVEFAGISRRVAPPDEHAEQEELKELISASISSLDDRRQQILTWRFGLDGNDPLTLEEVGDRLGVTRERIRQLEKDSLEKLAKTQRGLMLLDYLPEEFAKKNENEDLTEESNAHR